MWTRAMATLTPLARPATRAAGTRAMQQAAQAPSTLARGPTTAPRWRFLFACGAAAVGATVGLSTVALAQPVPPPIPQSPVDVEKLHSARRAAALLRDADAAEGINDDGIVLTKLLKPTTTHPLIVLVACGSYSPITNMHLLVFEQARNYLQFEKGRYEVLGGFLSPVHDAYGKSSLIPQHHRANMCEAAVASSSWLSVQSWEMKQRGWTTTAETLCKYQSAINRAHLTDGDTPVRSPIRVKMLCGADLIESTLVPGLWAAEDLDLIFGTFGVVVIERVGLDLVPLIAASPHLAKYAANIDIVPQRITNTISSTSVRQLIQTQQSVRFLTPDAVIDYIKANKLYGHDPDKHPPAEYLESKL